jgi:hypothetical protein
MDSLVNEYLDYLQEGSLAQPAGVFIAVGLLYAIYKKWQKVRVIENGPCKKYKGKPSKLAMCVVKTQMKNSKNIIKQLQNSRHTCRDTRHPSRCQEKVRYYIEKYKERIEDAEVRMKKLKFKEAKQAYKLKLRKIKQKFMK